MNGNNRHYPSQRAALADPAATPTVVGLDRKAYVNLPEGVFGARSVMLDRSTIADRLRGFPPTVTVTDHARDRRRAKAAARQARWRARQHDEIGVVPVPVTCEIISLLIDLGWLSEHEAGDRMQIGAAIAKLLEDAAKNNP